MYLSPSVTSLSCLATGKFFRSTAWIKVKTAAFAPMPKAKVSTAVVVKPGVLRNCRSAKRQSCRNVENMLSPSVWRVAAGHLPTVNRGNACISCTSRMTPDRECPSMALDRPEADSFLTGRPGLGLLSRGTPRVSGSEGGTEEISLVPLGHTGSLRNFVSDQEVHERTFGRRLEIDWLFHVVEWRVIARDQPFLNDVEPVDFRVSRLHAIGDIDRGHALQHEGILIAADEQDFFRHRIGAEIVTQSLSREIHFVGHAGVLAPQHDHVFHRKIGARRAVDIHVGDDRFQRDHWIMRKVVGAEQAHFFSGDEYEEH